MFVILACRRKKVIKAINLQKLFFVVLFVLSFQLDLVDQMNVSMLCGTW